VTGRPLPPPGIYPQIYRGSGVFRGTAREKRAQLNAYLEEAVQLGVPGVVMHGFPRELGVAWDGLAKLCADHGLRALASWGLDGSKDNDRTRLTPREKGEEIGAILADPRCAAGLLDAEGQWDTDTGPADDMDEAGALELVAAVRARSADGLLGDQPWFAIEAHGDERRTAKPIGLGGTFAGFASDEFATGINWVRATQNYWCDFWKTHGAGAYRYVMDRNATEWATHEASLARLGLVRPRTITVQGYGHDERPWHLVDCLLRYRDRVVIMWSNPFPTAITTAAMDFVRFLVGEGLAPAGVDAREIVKAFQRSMGVDADGFAGRDTFEKAGIHISV
jgi:hypothetical protein